MIIDKYNTLLECAEDLTKLTLTDEERMQYRHILSSDAYKEYKNTRLLAFSENIDLLLIDRLYKISKQLDEIDVNNKNYPSLLREYNSMLKLTKPLFERFKQLRNENDEVSKRYSFNTSKLIFVEDTHAVRD